MKSFDAVVIGAGPGGYPTAIRLAQLGKKLQSLKKKTSVEFVLMLDVFPQKPSFMEVRSFGR